MLRLADLPDQIQSYQTIVHVSNLEEHCLEFS
jgi:hypothetical protein